MLILVNIRQRPKSAVVRLAMSGQLIALHDAGAVSAVKVP